MLIQNLQANSQAQGAQDPYAQAPSQPQQAPQMPEQSMQQMPPQQSMPQQTPQAQYNPSNSGIKNAIEAARESLGMTNKQQEKSFNKGLINFATNFSQQPVRKGFFNNFGAASRSMLPALSEYSGAEEQYENQNNALANQILDRQAAEQQRLAQEEQQLWSRQMQEAQLNEIKRNNNLKLIKNAESQDSALHNKSWKNREKTNTSKLIPDISSQFTSNEEILPQIDELETLLTTSDLTGSSKLSAAKRYIAQQTGNDEDIVNAKNLGQFFLEWMQNNTTGVLSDKDIIVYSAGFADIEKNPEGSIKVLKRLRDKINKKQDLFSRQLKLYDEDPAIA